MSNVWRSHLFCLVYRLHFVYVDVNLKWGADLKKCKTHLVFRLFLLGSLLPIDTSAAFDAKDIETIRAIVLETQEHSQNQVPVGTILPYGGSGVLPDGFIDCDGRSLPTARPNSNDKDYSSLYAVIGYSYTPVEEKEKGTFRLPDLRGRTPIGAEKRIDPLKGIVAETGENPDPSKFSKRCVGESCGQETHTLSVAEMPAHDHDFHDPGHEHKTEGKWTGAQGAGWDRGHGIGWQGHSEIKSTKETTGIRMNAQGGNAAHNIMQPSLAVGFIIKWKGDPDLHLNGRVPASVPLVSASPTEKSPVNKK